HAAVVAPRRLRPQLSAATERIVLRALQKHPSRRFANAGEMRRALLAAAAQPKRSSPRSWSWTAPRAWSWAAPRAWNWTAARSGSWAAPRLWIWVVAAAPLMLLLVVGAPKLATARQASVPPLAGQTVDAAHRAA